MDHQRLAGNVIGRTATERDLAQQHVDLGHALVVGLQGRFQEAEQLAAQELDPQQAAAQVAQFRPGVRLRCFGTPRPGAAPRRRRSTSA